MGWCARRAVAFGAISMGCLDTLKHKLYLECLRCRCNSIPEVPFARAKLSGLLGLHIRPMMAVTDAPTQLSRVEIPVAQWPKFKRRPPLVSFTSKSSVCDRTSLRDKTGEAGVTPGPSDEVFAGTIPLHFKLDSSPVYRPSASPTQASSRHRSRCSHHPCTPQAV